MTDQRKLLERALLQLRDTRARLAAAVCAAREPISVLGAGVRLPGDVADLEAFWNLLRDGVDAVTPSVDTLDGHRPEPADRAENGRWAGLLTEVDGFDAGFFGISPAEAAKLDPQQRLVLEVAWEAMEDAGLPLETLQRAGTGVFLGVYNSDYLTLQYDDPAVINTYTAPGGAHSVLANRLSYLLDLRGPSLAVDTACSSSLMAVHLAVRALRQGECDIALAGGVNIILNPVSTLVTEKVLPLAPGGRCRTFDAAADGIIRAEGCGVLVLTRESLAAGRRVRAVIRGTAANHDGRTNGLTAPNPRAQADLLRRALGDAGVRPEQVTYIEAHGTGTPLGDPIEVEALREVYGDGSLPCALGSVKTNFGHQEAAAGVTGLIKAMLVLEHGQVPPNVHLRRLNPEIDLAGSRLSAPGRAHRPGPWRARAAGGGQLVRVRRRERPRDRAGAAAPARGRRHAGQARAAAVVPRPGRAGPAGQGVRGAAGRLRPGAGRGRVRGGGHPAHAPGAPAVPDGRRPGRARGEAGRGGRRGSGGAAAAAPGGVRLQRPGLAVGRHGDRAAAARAGGRGGGGGVRRRRTGAGRLVRAGAARRRRPAARDGGRAGGDRRVAARACRAVAVLGGRAVGGDRTQHGRGHRGVRGRGAGPRPGVRPAAAPGAAGRGGRGGRRHGEHLAATRPGPRADRRRRPGGGRRCERAALHRRRRRAAGRGGRLRRRRAARRERAQAPQPLRLPQPDARRPGRTPGRRARGPAPRPVHGADVLHRDRRPGPARTARRGPLGAQPARRRALLLRGLRDRRHRG
ncbi:hypothetical protein GCM10020220_070170 [Nonomuraea rubra]